MVPSVLLHTAARWPRSATRSRRRRSCANEAPRAVLASLGADGRLLVDATGTWFGHATAAALRSNVGAADASLAGFLSAGGSGPRRRPGGGGRPLVRGRPASCRHRPIWTWRRSRRPRPYPWTASSGSRRHGHPPRPDRPAGHSCPRPRAAHWSQVFTAPAHPPVRPSIRSNRLWADGQRTTAPARFASKEPRDERVDRLGTG